MDIKFSKKNKEILKNLDVQAVILFGSYVNGKPHKLSDIDIGILFNEPNKYKDKTTDVYFKIYNLLIDVLPKKYLKSRLDLKEHEVDIVFLQFAPVYLQFEAITKGKILYAPKKERVFAYKENIAKMFCDLKYFYDISFNVLMARI